MLRVAGQFVFSEGVLVSQTARIQAHHVSNSSTRFTAHDYSARDSAEYEDAWRGAADGGSVLLP